MKIKVDCGNCGAGFEAPAMLAGQTVRCARCGGPVVVPEAARPAAEPGKATPGGGGWDLGSLAPTQAPGAPKGKSASGSSRLASLMGSSAGKSGSRGGSRAPAASSGGSSLGRKGGSKAGSSMGSRSGVPAAGSGLGARAAQGGVVDASPQPGETAQELDERMARLYGVYMNKELHAERKGKFTLGLGISLAVVLVGLALGGFILMNSSNAVTPVVHTPAQSARGDGPVAAPTAEDLNLIKPASTWVAAGPEMLSPIALSQAEVHAFREPGGAVHRFDVELTPTDAARSQMDLRIQVALYRAGREAGPYDLVSRAAVMDLDRRTSEVRLSVSDEHALESGTNRAWYRVLGLDGEGRRLFETAAVDMPVAAAPEVTPLRVRWRPVRPGPDAPVVTVAFTLNAEGWKDLPLAEISSTESADGTIDAALPTMPVQAPTRTVMYLRLPTTTIVRPGEASYWQYASIAEELEAGSGIAATPAGIVPIEENGTLSYRLVPGPEAFDTVSESSSGEGTVLQFRLKGQAVGDSLTLPSLPAPRGLGATPFDTEVRLAWDNTDLLARANQFVGEVVVGVYRTGRSGERALLGTVPLGTSSFADTTARPDESYTYELELVRGGAAAGVTPAVRLAAWIGGIGEVPVLAHAAPTSAAVQATTDAALQRLTVAIGRGELAYAGSDLPAIEAEARLVQALLSDPDVAVLHRAASHWMQRSASQTMVSGSAPTAPAHVHLRLVDVRRPTGPALSLVADDLVTGEQAVIAESALESFDAAGFVRKVHDYLAPRRRLNRVVDMGFGQPPARLLIGPFIPADQPALYWQAQDLPDVLAEAAREASVTALAGPDAAAAVGGGAVTDQDVLLVGRAWTEASGQARATVLALAPTTSEVLGQFDVEPVSAASAAAAINWALTLKPTPARLPGGVSPTLAVERSLRPVHPVWQSALRDRSPAMMLLSPRRERQPGSVTVALGEPLPLELRDISQAGVRDAQDPLAVIRPYVDQSTPLTFTEWADRYAQWVQTDLAAFQTGVERVNELLNTSAGQIRPYLIVRGVVRADGSEVVQSRTRLSGRPEHLVVYTYLTPEFGEPLVSYRRDLMILFSEQPWLAYHAWRQVPRSHAESLLQAVACGIYENQRLRNFVEPKAPPALDAYVAARILDRLGDPQAQMFCRTSRTLAEQALGVLRTQRPGAVLRASDYEHARNALLLLLFENHPDVIQALRNPQFRDSFLVVPPAQAADTLRLLVDRVGPEAWDWSNGPAGHIDWARFRWQSPQEMRTVVDVRPDLLPEAYREQVRSWLNSETALSAGRMSPALQNAAGR